MLKKATGTLQKFLPRTFSKKTASVMGVVRLKKIYDRYGAVCDEIGRLLGEPEAKPQPLVAAFDQRPRASTESAPNKAEPTITAYDRVWQWGNDIQQRYTQTLSLASGFFDAGFITRSHSNATTVRSYFLDDEATEIQKALAFPLERLVPAFTSETSLKPCALEASRFTQAFRIKQLDWIKEAVVFHFWLNPEEGISLIVVTHLTGKKCLELLMQTQELIQRRFYDVG